MKAPGINQQDNGYMEPPPAYDDIANQQPTTPRPVPRTSLARSAQVSTSLMNMRNGQLIPQHNGGTNRVASPPNRYRQQQAAALPSKLKPQFDSTSRRSNSPCESEKSCSFKKHDTSGNRAATLSIPTQVVGIVNGTKGKVKENIQRSTGTTIQFIEDERNSTITGIRISGGSSGIAHAESYIFDLLKSARQLQEYESENIGSEFLPKIASWEKAEIIQFFKETTVFFEIRSGVLFLKGFSAEDVENAERKLYEMLTEEPENSMLELKIPSSQGGIIAGHQYSLVTKLMEQTRARIELLPQDLETTVRITGVPSCVTDAADAVYKRIQLSNKLIEKVCDSVPPVVAMVNEWTSSNFVDFYIGFGALVRCSGTTLILRAFSRNDLERAEVYLGSLASEYDNVDSERKSAAVLEIYVPDSLIGLIIGNRGANIKRIQEQTGAKIVTSRESDGSGQTKVRLEGSEEAISAAKAAIEQLQSWAGQNKPREILPKNKKLIRIPKSLCGLIVGKGGKTIESMKTKSGAGIMIKPADDFEIVLIRVSGDSSNIAEAERLIYHQLERVKELKKMPCNSVPAAALSEWRLTKIVEFFSRTGCFLEVAGSDVEIKGFDIGEMIVAEEELQIMVEDASDNKDINMIRDQTAHDLGRLNLNQQKTSRSSTPVLRKMSDDPKRKTAQSKTKKSTPAAPPELNKPKLDCADIAVLVNPMLESWSSDQLIVFQRETCTTINFDYSSLTLEGLCMDDLYDTKNELFQRAKRARERASPR